MDAALAVVVMEQRQRRQLGTEAGFRWTTPTTTYSVEVYGAGHHVATLDALTMEAAERIATAINEGAQGAWKA